jgi:hypothetical protein
MGEERDDDDEPCMECGATVGAYKELKRLRAENAQLRFALSAIAGLPVATPTAMQIARDALEGKGT